MRGISVISFVVKRVCVQVAYELGVVWRCVRRGCDKERVVM